MTDIANTKLLTDSATRAAVIVSIDVEGDSSIASVNFEQIMADNKPKHPMASDHRNILSQRPPRDVPVSHEIVNKLSEPTSTTPFNLKELAEILPTQQQHSINQPISKAAHADTGVPQPKNIKEPATFSQKHDEKIKGSDYPANPTSAAERRIAASVQENQKISTTETLQQKPVPNEDGKSVRPNIHPTQPNALQRIETAKARPAGPEPHQSQTKTDTQKDTVAPIRMVTENTSDKPLSKYAQEPEKRGPDKQLAEINQRSATPQRVSVSDTPVKIGITGNPISRTNQSPIAFGVDDKRQFMPASIEPFGLAETGSRQHVSSPPQAQVVQNLNSYEAKSIAQQLAAQITKQNDGSTTIRLNPEELGPVRMSLRNADGVMVMTILAERPETAEIMRRHITELAQEFQALGYESMTFEFSGDGPGQDNFRDQVEADGPSKVEPTGLTQPEQRQIDSAPDARLDLRL
ncbi:MAG: flagellar hook-length control protein FliK [Yoonia sp.]|uniref:flagellar hook-length control protein FliK n=1 Tax=Yoonia sp. TaxID=2212373 RepID=UPI0032760510